jgi:hypothetical protein
MTDSNDDMRATAREWRIAMFVVLGGFIIAVAIAAYFALRPAPATEATAVQPPAPLTAQQRAVIDAQLKAELCSAELSSAKGFGIVPPYGKVVDTLKNGDRRGRYICTASTGVAKYAIAADLVCAQLLDARCVNLYSVTSDDGTVLYKRTDTKPAK